MGASIAVVDDEANIRETVAFALRREGYEVLVYPDGIEAWDAFREQLPDLVILDILMPRMDGLELCRKVRSVNDAVPIIFLTSRDDELDRILGLELGADDYLCKPCSMRELFARVRVLFRRAALRPAPARIVLRLMLFNILLVFLPVAGPLLLVTYEQTRERAEIEAMQRQAHIVVAAMPNVKQILQQWRPSDGRLRVVDTKGNVIADSGPLQMDDEYEGAHNNWLYRAGAALLKKPFNAMRKLSRPLMSSNQYERAHTLDGPEVQRALLGLTAVEKRVSSGTNKQVMLYVATPLYRRGNTIGAIVISRTTDEIRRD